MTDEQQDDDLHPQQLGVELPEQFGDSDDPAADQEAIEVEKEIQQ